MKIIVAKTAGFCAGVKRAVDIALTATLKAPDEGCAECVSIGPLIHNEDMVRELESKGVHVVEGIDEVLGRRLIIPSHGTIRGVSEQAEGLGLCIIDATCPHVIRLKQLAIEWEQSGGIAVIAGDKGHPELKGVASYLKDPIIGNDIGVIMAEMANRPGKRFLLMSQTTGITEELDAIYATMKAAVLEVEYCRTICPATQQRQAEVSKLADDTDAMIVLGGRRSANTNRLEQIAQNSGKPVYRASNLSELNLEEIMAAGYGKLGITAGASTPNSIIEEVVRAMIESGAEKELTMAELEKLYPEKKEEVQAAPKKKDFQIVTGKVTLVTEDEVLADVGQGSDVHIPKNQLTFSKAVSPLKMFQPGDSITVAVEEYDDTKDVQYASKLKADALTAWQKAQDAFESGEAIEGVIVEAVKGGVVVDMGIRGFMPASQIGSRVEDLSTLVGTKVKAKVIELEEARKGAVLSTRALAESETAKQRQENIDKVQVNAIFEGTVRKLMPFGAFVNLLPGIDGLLHVSELSWQRIGNPSEVLSEGMKVQVKVISVDSARGKISLSMKQLSERPRSKTVTADLSEGAVYKGTVVKLMNFGAFVKMENGAEGLVHVSQISEKRVQTPDEILSVGQDVKVKVLSVNEENGRISLSIKDAELKEQRDEFEGYMKSAEEDFQITIADRIRIKGEQKR